MTTPLNIKQYKKRDEFMTRIAIKLQVPVAVISSTVVKPTTLEYRSSHLWTEMEANTPTVTTETAVCGQKKTN
jgi:hypothetical protein